MPRWVTITVNLGDSYEDEEMKSWLRTTAAARGVSMSALVRGLIQIAYGKARAKQARAASK